MATSLGGHLITGVRIMKIQPSKAGCIIAIALCVTVFLFSCWPCLPLVQPRLYRGSLHRSIAEADRIVVRDGGDTCCVSAEETLKQPVLFEVRDQREVASVRDHLRFFPVITQNHCLCCGHPGIDWYRGEERLAITAWKHGFGIMWGGGENLAHLTWGSRRWLKQWLREHGISETEMR